jgi:FkbM family methyltransferase
MDTPTVRGITASQLKTALQKILDEPVASVKEREQTALESRLVEVNNRCVLFGAGSVGRRALTELKQIGIQPLAISDNNPQLWNTAIDGTEVLSPKDAAARFGLDAVFFITIRNEQHWYRETFEKLKSLGCVHVESAAAIGWRWPATFLPFLLYDLPHKLYEQADNVLRAAELWEDDASREQYLANVRLRALGDPSNLPKSTVAFEDPYFIDGLFEARSGEMVLDCGAFDGDTIRSLIARQPDFGEIEAVEADSNSFTKLKEYVGSLELATRNKIRLHHCAVGAEKGVVLFENDGSDGSKISDLGTTKVDMLPIDELCASTRLTMIKMDIEGAEFDALVGAKQLIQRDRPILAICVYHSQQDLWRLPLVMRGMVPEYQMYLRTSGGDGIQTVAYALPPERTLIARKG